MAICNSYSALSVRYGSNTALTLWRFVPSGLVLCLNHIAHQAHYKYYILRYYGSVNRAFNSA